MSFDEKILIQNFVRKVARSGSCNAFSEVQVVAVEFGLFLNIFTFFESGSGCHFWLSKVGMRSTTLSTTCGGGDHLLAFILDDHPFEIE